MTEKEERFARIAENARAHEGTLKPWLTKTQIYASNLMNFLPNWKL
jgi:hypothetical protein